MKVTGPNGISSPGAGQGAKRASGAGFSLPALDEAGASTGVTRAGGTSPVGSLDALIALQQVDDPTERRRRAIQRGGRLLDMLERLKLALLGEEPGEGELRALATAVREQRTTTGDPHLEALLDQIETRAAVELAKRLPTA
jgi:hypothetical protein